jgi:hypothetical protein
MEMHLRLDEMSSSKELQKKVEAVMAQLDEQLKMIGEYTDTVEEMVPSSKADITGEEDFGEVVEFLTKYVTVIERQLVSTCRPLPRFTAPCLRLPTCCVIDLRPLVTAGCKSWRPRTRLCTPRSCRTAKTQCKRC